MRSSADSRILLRPLPSLRVPAPSRISVCLRLQAVRSHSPLRRSTTAPGAIPVASVSVSPATSSMQVGGTAQFSAVTRDANNNVLTERVVNWSSSNTTVGTVSASGLVTAVAAGTAQITATSEGQIGSANLTVTSPLPPPSATRPGTVSDLSVSAVAGTSVT